MNIVVSTRADAAAREAMAAGARDIVPAVIGVIPLAVLIGVTVVDSPISPLVGWLAGPIIAGGSAHLAILGGIGGSAMAAVASGLLVNVRGLIYSAALGPVFAGQPRWFRWLAPYVLVDQSFALAMTQTHRPQAWMRRYYLTATAILYTAYVAAITVGVLIGPVIPPDSPVSLAIPIMFATILLGGLEDRSALTSAGLAAVVALLGGRLPAGLGLIAAVVAGTTAASMVNRHA
jgi:predicted branched-subunit amino acid permease